MIIIIRSFFSFAELVAEGGDADLLHQLFIRVRVGVGVDRSRGRTLGGRCGGSAELSYLSEQLEQSVVWVGLDGGLGGLNAYRDEVAVQQRFLLGGLTVRQVLAVVAAEVAPVVNHGDVAWPEAVLLRALLV